MENTYQFVLSQEELHLFDHMVVSISQRLLVLEIMEWLKELGSIASLDHRSIQMNIMSPNEMTLFCPDSCHQCFPYVIWISSGNIMRLDEYGTRQSLTKQELYQLLNHYIRYLCCHEINDSMKR
jgi:hypothetical protein